MEHITRLEAAMVAVTRAVDARGLRIYLCNVRNAHDVRSRMLDLSRWLNPGHAHISWDGVGEPRDDKHAESNTARNLALLAELLSAHLEYEHERRVNPDECKHQTS